MSRPQRNEFTNAVHHLTSRGDHREAIFDDCDRQFFLDLLDTVPQCIEAVALRRSVTDDDKESGYLRHC
jgi:hypothetical protein